jgi:hypothetical protein
MTPLDLATNNEAKYQAIIRAWRDGGAVAN